MTESIEAIMELASQKLTGMDYLSCERLCLQALAMARTAQDWVYYRRILMPLQECRRQRRMIASEGSIRIGTNSLTDMVSDVDKHKAGCLVVTEPHSASIAKALNDWVVAEGRYIEVLFAKLTQSSSWTIQSFAGPDVSCPVAAPQVDWCDGWMPGQGAMVTQVRKAKTRSSRVVDDVARSRPSTTGGERELDPDNRPLAPTPADWFLDAMEAIGDAALASITSELGTLSRVIDLESCLEVVTDHEIIHQRLGDAAEAIRL